MYRYKLFNIKKEDESFREYLNDNVFVGEQFKIITKNKSKLKDHTLFVLSERPVMSNKVNEISNTAKSIYYSWDSCRNTM